MGFTFESKIDGCSLRRIGELPFRTNGDLKCIGIPGAFESIDKILLSDTMNGVKRSFLYVLWTTIFG